MEKDAFSRFHPAVNFIFFVGAIGFGVVLQHPAYMAAGLACAFLYLVQLTGWNAIKSLAGMLPVAVLISLMNPVFNPQGETVLFVYLDRNFTLESLCYGLVLGGMFLLMMLWFACYNLVLTSDKFICLFGSLIPALSLLLVMVLRLIPGFMRKTAQIIDARNAIGKGVEGTSYQEKAASGFTILSALTDWALEGSIVTADSMRSRGYGAAKRTSYRIYRMSFQDWVLIAVECILVILLLIAMVSGVATAEYLPKIIITGVNWGFGAYLAFLLIPVIIEWKEAVQWRILRSRI